MPSYNFLNTKTKKEEEHFMWISELEEFQSTNPHMELLVSAHTNVLDPHRMGRIKPDSVFREHLRGMKKYYGSTTMEVD